ncbi:MAG: bifunctional phosphoglucose/phosphomannose isomerase [Fimbriimonadaceae bacterium]|nr:bifunctional phosphoglucose/phosphomannose isomerase [Fimbriimonadaceae bacterium]
MPNLDSKSDVLRLDPKGMYQLTADFPDQVAQAVALAEAASLPDWSARPDVVVLTGMGGSAAGGDYVKAAFDEAAKVPFLVNRDYVLPAWVGAGALVFATSYSGNTEETIASYLQARRLGANIIVVTSGGKLAEMAKEDGFPLITIPAGQPPRTALGYLLIPVLVACIRLKLIPAVDFASLVARLKAVVEKNRVEVPFEENEAKQLASESFGRPVQIYGLGSWQGAVAYRWKGQFCENAKCLAFCHTYPELCHNEILGWGNADNQSPNGWALFTLRDGRESAKMEARGRISADLIKEKAINRYVDAEGDSLMEKMLTLTLKGDFASIYLAALYEVDPESIDLINILKTELSKIPMD